jgi:ParB-like chromosome segregation protein Spo0J
MPLRNTGIEYSSTEKNPVVLPELSQLLPPLDAEQLSVLEADILTNGCYSPVIVNEDLVIVDDHHRRKICQEHDISELYWM